MTYVEHQQRQTGGIGLISDSLMPQSTQPFTGLMTQSAVSNNNKKNINNNADNF